MQALLVIRVFEIILTCMVLVIYLAWFENPHTGKFHYMFFEVAFFGSAMMTILFLLVHWLRDVTGRARTGMWLETVFSTMVSFGYIVSAIVCQPTVRRYELNVEMTDQQIYSLIQKRTKATGLLTGCCLFCGIWFSLHSILTTDMYPTNFENNLYTKESGIKCKWLKRNTKALRNPEIVDCSIFRATVDPEVSKRDQAQRSAILKQMLGTRYVKPRDYIYI